ncbi:TIGR00341 family protein [Desulfocurvibacter africanus]|uniref:TIGR00341 family protein n=1 Tax=Desulfocurvibacter africanus TaxID=873 RepID=UPI0004800770|nr:TIGR00341 family protein [Desulfocurvibacter africanus]
MRSKLIKTTPERRAQVIGDISQGSEPGIRFYILVGISTLIASIGLIADSTAVVIGAMLVAPLMTPIFGISLALVLGEAKLLRNSLLAVTAGIFIAVATALLLGSLPIALEVTPEMLSRTQPNLFDLLVAVLAGFAGAYALVDESLSPALPGVAIATALVPPLANTGLCIAVKAYEGGLGSFLLFVANFLSILIVASAVFIVAGMNYRFDSTNKKLFLRRFGLAAFGFLIIFALLTNSLIAMIEDRILSQDIKQVLDQELAGMYGAELNRFNSDFESGKLYVLAHVMSPELFVPKEVKQIQDALSKKLDKPVEFTIRNTIVKDMGATGSTPLVEMRNLEGFFEGRELTRKELVIRETEQLLWELTSEAPGTQLEHVDFGMLPIGPTVVATITGRPPFPEIIRAVQDDLRKRLEMPDLYLLVEVIEPDFWSSQGRLLLGWTRYGKLTPDKERAIKTIENAVREAFSRIDGLFPHDAYFDFGDGRQPVKILVAVSGGREPAKEDLAHVQDTVAKASPLPVEMYMLKTNEAMLTRDGYVPLAEKLRKNVRKRLEEVRKNWHMVN